MPPNPGLSLAIHQAMKVINDRNERGKRYTVFSDSQAALSRIQCDRTGPGQTLAILAIETANTIIDRDNSITFRWTPAHAGVEGNERADGTARRAAEDRREMAPPEYLKEASLSHLRTTTEARSAATAEWIRAHSGRRRRYRPPKGGKMRKALSKTRKEVASRFYQLLSGHAAVAEHLKRAGQTARPASGVGQGRDRRGTTYLSSAEDGPPRSKRCGRGLGQTVDGGVHPRCDACLEMRAM